MKKEIRIFLLGVLLVFMSGNTELFAQVKANPENYFVSPGVRKVLDVLKNDDPGACSENTGDLVLEITSPVGLPATLQNLEVSADNKIVFRSKTTFYGQFKFTYKISCPASGQSSSADVYVNVGNKPDFIDEAECIVDPVPFVWDIERKAMSDDVNYVQSYASVVVGNLDDDDQLEIVTLDFSGAGNRSNKILIFNYDKDAGIVNLKKAIDTPPMPGYTALPLAIADVDDDGEGEIIVGFGDFNGGTSSDFKLRAYKVDGSIVWESTDTYFVNKTGYKSSTISVHDIDGDGTIEIFAGDRIFAGESGNLLATLPAGGRGTRGGYLPAVGDIDGDGKMEIVCGNTTYKVTINSRTNPELNTATVLAKIALGDGYTSLADIDCDGILDVIVVSSNDANYPTTPANLTQMYVWQGSTGARIGNVVTPTPGKNLNTGVTAANAYGGSRAFVGDINNDGRPEICFTHYCKMEAYAYNPGTNIFTSLWTDKYTTDTSAATTMSMFDFNNDGEVELVYRDETHIRIIDKNGNNVKDQYGVEAKYVCNSGTHTEYPVVADLDGDGHAEIIVSGSLNLADGQPGYVSGLCNATCRVMVYGSKTADTWAPARRVWNQHGYNPLNVNEDLSIPAKPLAPSTQLTHKDGTLHRPFNSFIQQAGVLNTEGESLNLAPDLGFQVGKNQKFYHNTGTDVMTVTAYLTNNGSMDFSGDIKLSLYLYDQGTSQYSLKGSKVFTGQTLAMRQYKTYSFDIASFSSIVLPASYLWYVVINLDDQGTSAPADAYLDQRECNYWNNLSSRISYISGHILLCKNESGTLNIDPSGAYDCYWFNPDGSPYPGSGTNMGDSKSVTKQTDDYSEYFLIDTYQKGTLSKIGTDTVFMYRPADTLVWTGSENSDWNNILNWDNPDDVLKEEQISYIPRGCTNVLIPDQVSRYPDLSSGVTDYSVYSDSKCNNISFEHGGEVLNSHLLVYSKAYVQLELLSNRWYCFSPPLRDFYSGDIYLTDPDPFGDNMFSYVRLFSQQNPQFNYVEGNWGKTFSIPNYRFGPGQGAGVWLDDLDPDATNHQGMDFTFPKHDADYNIYTESGVISSGPYATPRGNEHRFIFEETINSSTKVIPLQVEATSAGKDILIGNPFMSHWDFDKFYNYGNNKNLIEDHYRVMDSGGNYSTYSISGVSTGTPVLTKYVAPMQSVLVTPKTTFAGSLVAHPSQTGISAGNKLRSQGESSPEFMLVSVSDSVLRNRCALVLDASAASGTGYSAHSDIYKVLKQGIKNSVTVYFLTQEGHYMDIKSLSSLDNVELGLGICTAATGSLCLGFERLWSFGEGYDVYLLDKEKGVNVNLRESSLYTFEKTSADSYLNNRFVLSFVQRGTSIEKEDSYSQSINYTVLGNVLEVYTGDGSRLDELIIYDLHGRLVSMSSGGSNDRIWVSLTKGLYIARARSGKLVENFKVIIR